MSSRIVPPFLEESSSGETPAKAPPSEGTPPAATGPGTASADDLGMSLGQVSPDPFLEEFEADRPAAGPGPSRMIPPSVAQALAGLDLDVPPSAELPAAGSQTSGVSAVVAALNLEPTAAPPVVDFSTPPGSRAASESAHARKGVDHAQKAKPMDELEEEDLPARNAGWPMALLASYASAVTLGLIWVLWSHRVPRGSVSVEADPFPPVRAIPDPGHRAGQSRKFIPPESLPAGRVIRLGETIRLGSLEVTPLEVVAGRVVLRREINEFEPRRGGNDALMLRLRLANLSSGSVLVPLDEAFIRQRGRGIHDSFIETGPTRQIEMYPLAIVSEWSIVGQEFRELNPGESYETLVVSAAGALGHLASEMTWRIRLRTDINQTATLGVRFTEDQVRKLPGRPSDAEEPDETREPKDRDA